MSELNHKHGSHLHQNQYSDLQLREGLRRAVPAVPCELPLALTHARLSPGRDALCQGHPCLEIKE